MVVFWIMHATEFLKEPGRLGMIVSDSWLQADYGVRFGKFLLDHFKIHAIIDLSPRVFRTPLVANCIILLERSRNPEERDSNNVVFALLNVKSEGINVDKILEIIEGKRAGVYEFNGSKVIVKVYRQGDIKEYDDKWIGLLFEDANEIIENFKTSPNVTILGKYFEPTYGNTLYTVLYTRRIVKTRHAGIGGQDFFYLTEDEARKHGIPREFLHPLIPSSRYMKFFVFREDDWKDIKSNEGKCYIFMAHKPRTQLPQQVLNYIKLGETIIALRKGIYKGQPVSRSRAADERHKLKRYFCDWYDLGGVIDAPIYVTYGARYWLRFVLSKFNCVLDHRILALIPREGVEFDEVELKALLAFLNSSFGQLQAEVKGRTAGGVALLELDVKPLSEFLVIDVKSLPRDVVEGLSKLFDKLEAEARRLGGADTAENVFGPQLAGELTGRDVTGGVEGLFNTVIREIDYEIARVLGLEHIVDYVRSMVIELVKRRLSRAGEAKTSAIKGEPSHVELKGRKGKVKGVRRPKQRTLEEYLK